MQLAKEFFKYLGGVDSIEDISKIVLVENSDILVVGHAKAVE